ncbi:hypothetical protein A7K94_0221470 [Modestobacter sp. VKM Ac-2676]|nr:hypothetical protein A7K94_0221470 [Modestobacter sp. VKM Ac-2676]
MQSLLGGLVFTVYGALLLGTDDDLDLSLTQALLSGLVVGVVAGLTGARGARRGGRPVPGGHRRAQS